MTANISIVTDEISQDLDICREFMDEHDIRAIEVRTVSGNRVPFLSGRDFDKLKRLASSGDVRVTALSPGVFKLNRDDEKEIRRHMEDLLPRSIDVAGEFGASYVIAFTFMDPQKKGPNSRLIDLLRDASEACERGGVRLLLENEPGYMATTADEMLDLIQKISHPGCAINWDPANSNTFKTEDLTSGLNRIFPQVQNVHVKNCQSVPGKLFPRYTTLSEGEIDWLAHAKLLYGLGYKGNFCIETHFEPLLENSGVVVSELRDILEETGY